MTEHSIRKQQFWFKVLRVICACILILLVVGVIKWGIDFWQVNSQIAAIRNAGLPTNFEELDRYYERENGIPNNSDLWNAAFDAANKAEVAKSGMPLFEEDIPPFDEPWDQLDSCRDYLKKIEPELVMIRKAATAGGQVIVPRIPGSDPISRFMDSSSARIIPRILNLDMNVSLRDGDVTRALQDVRDAFKASNAISRGAVMINALIRNALFSSAIAMSDRLLNSAELTDSQLAELQNEIAGPDFLQEINDSLIGERSFQIASIDSFPVSLLLWQPSKREMLSENVRVRKILSKGLPEATRNLDSISKTQAKGFPLVELIGPSHAAFIESGANMVAKQHSRIVAISVQRHALRHGRFPETLNAIDADLFPSDRDKPTSIVDPYTGDPLRFVDSEKEILIYSIGSNLIDDGGNFDEMSQGRDVGIRLLKKER
ncbi:hypothetical protein SH668x_001864 [Planctomicrobium sp. SH668]|uniref:hypothetical protein n=1 Tax=Planctomicrobium sp. SH668 TaxID=3448126 RepID=UPI003F5AEB66